MNPIRAWNRFWFAPVSARPLAAFRIVVGLVALFNLFLLSLELDYWFTDTGLLRGVEARQAAGPWRPSVLQYVQDPVSVRAFFAATAAVAVLFTIGWRTRVMSVLLYLGLLMIHHRNVSSANGADVLLVVLAFYLMLSPCGAAYSLDALRARRRRGGTPAEPLIVPWAQRLIQIQLALIYLNTALMKASGETWQDGTALHFVFHNAEVRRFDLGLAQFPLLVNAMTYTALLVEFAIPFLIWVRNARPWVIASGLALHGGILFVVNIPIFGELMTACYLTFLSPEELDAALRALNPRSWFGGLRRQSADDLPLAPRYDLDAPNLPGPHWGIDEAPRDNGDLVHAGDNEAPYAAR